MDAAIRSTLNRRVDLPSGGYLLFDFAEAFTVIDVNTGRFVGGGGRLEDTITRNNIEAAREVIRQLRLRDIGGIIVVDFIDMASHKNRTEVLKVMQAELEKDRTKTYLVEISPLGLVEMTRQNVTEGVREILTRTCPTCGGEGVVLSEDTMAVEAERRLRKLARASGSEAFLIKVNAKVALAPGRPRWRQAAGAGARYRQVLLARAALAPRTGRDRRDRRRSARGDSGRQADGHGGARWCASRSPSRTCTTPPTRWRTSTRTRS